MGVPRAACWGGPREQASLTSSLTSRRMDGCSDMDLKRVPTTQHFSPGCSSHSFFVWTPLPRHSGHELRDQGALQAPQSTEHGNPAARPLSRAGGTDHQVQGPWT